MRDLICPGEMSQAAGGMRIDDLANPRRELRRRIVKRNTTESISVIKIKHAKARFADACRMFQNGLKYRLRFARRGADHFENFRPRKAVPQPRLVRERALKFLFLARQRVLPDGPPRLPRCGLRWMPP